MDDCLPTLSNSKNLAVILLLWTSEKINSHFAVNSWSWLLPRYLISCLSVKTFSCLCSYFCGGSFEGAIFKYVHVPNFFFFFEFLFIHCGCFLNACSFCFKKFLVIDKFWLNLVSDIRFLKSKKTKIPSIFMFSILYLHFWYTHTIIYF